MPKVVDRTEKREEVLEATWRLMARVGIDRVSIREIAAEAGCSTGVIAHYFKNKEDVLLSALRLVNSQEVEAVARSTLGLRGLTAVRAAIDEVLPVDTERRLAMTVWMSFWGRAVGDARLATMQRRSYGEWCSLLRRHFEEAVADTEVPGDLDCADEAARTAALIDGHPAISSPAVLTPLPTPPCVVPSVLGPCERDRAELPRAQLRHAPCS